MKNNKRTLRTLAVVVSAAFLLPACDEVSLKEQYANDDCAGLFGPEVPPGGVTLPPDTPDTTTPVVDATTLSAAVSFKQAVRKSGAVPLPGTQTAPGITIKPASLRITDNAQVVFDVVPDSIVSGQYIGAVFFSFDGTGEYFVAVIGEADLAAVLAYENALAAAAQADADASPGDSQLAATAASLAAQAAATAATLAAGGVRVTLLGPQPASSVDALIQGASGDAFSAPATVHAFWVPTGEQPDFTAATWSGSADGARWSPAEPLPTEAVAVGSGSFQATLTWDQPVDVDLHLTEPDGTHIYYAARTSTSGAQLDVDDVDGFGPENIFYPADVTPPPGLFQVDVVYFSDYDTGVPAAYTVTVNACNTSRTFRGVLTADTRERVPVLRFEFGDGCTLEDAVSGLVPDQPSMWEQALLCTESIAEARNN